MVAVKGDLKYMAQAFNLVRKPGSEEAHGLHGDLQTVYLLKVVLLFNFKYNGDLGVGFGKLTAPC